MIWIQKTKTAIKNSDKKISVKTMENYNMILDYMIIDKEYKTAEIAEVLGLKPPHTRKLLNELVGIGKIEALGFNRSRVYKLK